MDANVKINCETNGFDKATEQVETLTEAYDGFPANDLISRQAAIDTEETA